MKNRFAPATAILIATIAAGGAMSATAQDGPRSDRPAAMQADTVPPGFEEAAAKLGIGVQELLVAMGGGRPEQVDLAAVAARLGVSGEALRAALPPPPPPRG